MRRVCRCNRPAARLANKAPFNLECVRDSATVIDMATSKIVQKHKDYLFPAVAMYYQEPIALVRGEGPYVWDDQGKRYLDAFGGVLTVSVGHANPKVVDGDRRAGQDRSATPRRSTRTQPQSNLAEKLASIAPGNLKKIVLHQQRHRGERDGDERRPPRAPGGMEIIVLRHSYSGRSAADAGGVRAEQLEEAPDARCRAFITPTRRTATAARSTLEYPQCGLECAEDIEELIQTETGGEIAAFMAETIIGSGGFIVPPPGYFERAAAIARKYGGLFIADEVQTAWGRTGDHWLGIEHWNVEPDIMVSAKGMGNGAPVGDDDRHARSGRQVSRHHVRDVRRQPGLDGRGAGRRSR